MELADTSTCWLLCGERIMISSADMDASGENNAVVRGCGGPY